MTPQVNKQRVRESFDRAAATYDAAAIVQRKICDRLLERLPRWETAPAHILDAGCGTGYGIRELRGRWPKAAIVGVDFAPAMLEFARHETGQTLAADIEKLPLAAQRFDLWWSSLAIQWCDPASVFREAARVLRPGGRLALSTLGPCTFHELRSAFSGVDPHRHTLRFSETAEIAAALAGVGFGQCTLWRETHVVHYPDLKTLLRAVKDIGAHNVGEGGRAGMMGRAAWRAVEAAYEGYREPQGLPASYDAILAYAVR